MKQLLRFLGMAGALSGALCLNAGALAYPTDIQYPDETGGTVQKTYTVRAESEIDQLPRETFSLGDVSYAYLDTICQEVSTTEEQPMTQTDTLEVDTKDREEILAGMEQSRLATTPDGYSGVLTLRPDSLTVEPAAYGSSSSTKTLTRTYPNLSDADLSFLPKEVTSDGRTYTLTDVSWTEGSVSNPYDEEVGTRYTATAVYTSTVKTRYAKSYTVSVEYSGTVSRTTDEGIRCTLIFYPVTGEAGGSGDPVPAGKTNGAGGVLYTLNSVLKTASLALFVAVAAMLAYLLWRMILKSRLVPEKPVELPLVSWPRRQRENTWTGRRGTAKEAPAYEPEEKYPGDTPPVPSNIPKEPNCGGDQFENDEEDERYEAYEDKKTRGGGSDSGPGDDFFDYPNFSQ